MLRALVILFLTVVLAPPVEAQLGKPYVVGGQPVSVGQFPFVVRVYTTVAGQTFLCTGSLIRPSWVLTAAHCGVDGVPPSEVLIGDAEAGVDGPTHMVTKLSVANWIPHPAYDPASSKNDVALIQLSGDATQSPPTLNGEVQYVPTPISLATAPPTTASGIGPVAVAGFGRLDFDQSTNLVHWAGDLPTHTPATCNYAAPAGPITPTQQLCYAGYPNACSGDSGGPVFQSVGNGVTQVGVVSFGPQVCGTFPSVATYVPAYVSWINEQIDGPAEPESPIVLDWEFPPASDQGVATGVSNAQGWTFSREGTITMVRLELSDGQRLVSPPCCSERGGIPEIVPGAPLNTGFSAAVNWANLLPGLHDVTIIVRDSEGNELRRTRTIRTVRLLEDVPFPTDLSVGAGADCTLSSPDGIPTIACSGLGFEQGACDGTLTLAWSTGKQAFEVVEGCGS